VAAVRQGRPTVVAEVGDGPAVGQSLTGDRLALFRRALGQDDPVLVSRVIGEKGQRRLLLAMRVQGSRAVVYRGTALKSAMPVPSTQNAPFRGLRVALYASPTTNKSNLIVTNEDEPLTGSLEKLKIQVGADRWLLVVAERHPLAGHPRRPVPLVRPGRWARGRLARRCDRRDAAPPARLGDEPRE
jgi:hypothetical protein